MLKIALMKIINLFNMVFKIAWLYVNVYGDYRLFTLLSSIYLYTIWFMLCLFKLKQAPNVYPKFYNFCLITNYFLKLKVSNFIPITLFLMYYAVQDVIIQISFHYYYPFELSRCALSIVYFYV